ncbi:ABC transporter substrate-binding protein [Virgibacillus necropolis]|uniref:ABC transporter substrate-binding protein n=1 Tax=Virgibacillus necropolis TaxID=163877 RepID=UPI00384EBC89
MKRFPYMIIAITLLFSLMLVACSNETGTTKEGDSGQEKDKKDDVLVIAQKADLTTMDPQDALATPSENIFRNTYNRLFKRGANMETETELLQDYKIVNDTTWEFTLKEGIKFHNGESLTAEDVKFSIERVSTNEKLKEYPYFKAIKGVKVVDELHFKIVTEGPLPTLPRLLAKSGSDILPKDYIKENGWDHFLKKPIGSGPYKFVEWKPNSRVVLEPFENYFEGKVEEWKKVVFRPIPETSTRVGELLTGGVDIAKQIPPNEWERVNNAKGVSIVKGNTTRVMLLVVRTTEGSVTSDPRVREAIDLAINDQALAEGLLKGAGVPVRSRAPKGVIGYNPDLYNTYVYDPEKAKKLLAEAGYEDGLNITLTAPNGRYLMDSEVAQTLVGMLDKVGIKVNLDLAEWSNFLNTYNSNSNKELLLIGLADGLLDASYSLVHYTKERAEGQTDYYNPKVQKLYEEALHNMNKKERIKQLQKIQEIVAEERPHINLYQVKSIYGISDDINFSPRIDQQIYVPSITRK